MRMLLLVLGMLLIPAGAAAPADAPAQLAFVAAEGRVPQIFVIGADGTGRRRLTNAAGPSTTPVWSPDGRRIAFVRQTGDNAELYVMGADGGAPRALTTGSGRAASPAWAPDGRQIVFTASSDRRSRIMVVNSDGRQRRSVVPSHRDQRDAAWSPDGQLIVFLSRAVPGHFDLYVVGADGQNLRQVPTPAPGVLPDVKEFTWSPDGRLAYTNRSGPAQEAVTLTTVGGDARQYLGASGEPSWPPDGRRFAFVASHSGAALIYARDTAGGKALRLTDPRLTSVRPAWSPDGRHIAYLALERGTVTLTVMDADGGHKRPLAADVYGDLSARPVFSWRPR